MNNKKWENLTDKEKERFNKEAQQINESGLGPLAQTIRKWLKNGRLIFKDGKLRISGELAWKMKSELGIPPEILEQMVTTYFNDLKPKLK